MRYKIRLTKKSPVMPVVTFEDEKYSLLGEFLLAERGLLGHFSERLDELTDGPVTEAEVSGNVFTMTADNEYTTISNEITGQDITVNTSEFKELLLKYILKLHDMPKQ